MKKFRYIMMLLAVIGFTACDSDSIEDLKGEFDYITFCNFNTASVQPTVKLGKGIKALNTQFTDNAGNTLSLTFGSKEWILSDGTYTVVSNVTANKTYSGTVNGTAISEGSIDVNVVESTYFISGVVKTSDSKEYKVYFKGPMTFEVGIDDPEPSGLTMTFAANAIVDWTTGTMRTDVMNYVFIIKDENGNQIADIEAYNVPGLTAADLAGTYTVSGDGTAMTINPGYYYPEYGYVAGSNFVDESGVNIYMQAGSITLTTAKTSDGVVLYSFSGAGLGGQCTNGNTAEGAAFKFDYISLAE